jgi:hypothetical protein
MMATAKLLKFTNPLENKIIIQESVTTTVGG